MKKYIFFAAALLLSACNRSPEYYFEKGNRMTMSGRSMEALQMYNRAILLRRKYPEAFTSRGMVYEKLGDQQKAILDFKRALDMDPAYAPALNNLAAVYMDAGECKEAVKYLSRALENSPSYSYALLNRGVAEYKLLESLPPELQTSLPSIEQIERELGGAADSDHSGSSAEDDEEP